MPHHFGRFRILNDTKPTDPEHRIIKSATFKIGEPPVLHTVVGFGTPYLDVPPQYFAELELDPGMAQGDKVHISIEVMNPVDQTTLDIVDWTVKVAPAVLMRGVDVKVAYVPTATNHFKARATSAGDNCAFKEENTEF